MSKVYFHRTPGAKFYMPNGAEIAFAGGRFDSSAIRDDESRKAVELELDKVANIPSSHIYTMIRPVVGKDEVETTKELLSTATQQFDHVNKIPANTPTVPLPVSRDPQPTLNPTIAAEGSIAAVATSGGEPAQVAATVSIQDKLAAARAAINANPPGATGGSANTPNRPK